MNSVLPIDHKLLKFTTPLYVSRYQVDEWFLIRRQDEFMR